MSKKKKEVFVGMKFNYLNENEELVTCKVTKIEDNLVYFQDKKGNVYIESIEDFTS